MTLNKPPDFGTTKRLQQAYEKAIHKIVGRVLKPQQPGQSLDDWLNELAARSQAADVREAADVLARRMVSWVNVSNAKTWREASARTQHSRLLHNLLMKEMQGATGARVATLVRENAKYITSVPLEAATVLANEVLKAQQSGARASTINKMMRARFPKLLRSRVNLIARTETAKASTALTEARCEDLGIDWYEWVTSEDARVRLSHKRMNGVLIPWAQPPAPELLAGEKATLGHYHSGDCPNCRCTQMPLLTLDDVRWPHEVYWQGAIKYMTRTDFAALSHVERRAA